MQCHATWYHRPSTENNIVDKPHIFYSYVEMTMANLKSSNSQIYKFQVYTFKQKRKINKTELLEYHHFAKGTNHPIHYGTYISSAGNKT